MQDIQTVYTVQTVTKALELIELLASKKTTQSLPQLAEQIGLNRNKTFRLLATLGEKGLVEKDSSSGNYQLGLASVAFAQNLLKNSSVVNYAHPIMEDLARKHDEAVYMTVIKEDEVLFVDMVDCDQQVKATPLVGRTFPFFTNAAGKVMRALDSRELLEKFTAKYGKRGGAPDMETLVTELNEIRRKGVAVDCGGLGEGIISVAVVVRDYAGKVVGAITMLGPSFRMMASRIENEIIPSLLEGGELLSAKFGFARL